MELADTIEKQLAYYHLVRYCSQIIPVKGCPYYDYIVSTADSSSKFAVGIISCLTKDIDITTIIENIRGADLESNNSQLAIPLIFMYIDTNSGDADFQTVLEWNFGIPKVSLGRRFRWEKKNVTVLFSNLDQTIRILPQSMWRVVKKISIDFSLDQLDIVYSRRFSDMYKMTEHPKLSDIEDFNRKISGIPESDYPRDLLDDKLYELFKDYPGVNRTSSLLLLNSDLRQIQLLGQKKMVRWNIAVLPESMIFEDSKAVFPSISLEAFCHSNRSRWYNTIIQNDTISINSDVLSQTIKLINETYQPISSFIIK